MSNARELSQVPNQNLSLKNRIINGAMVIDQRNAGASVTVNSATQFYPVDRWAGIGQATDGVFTLQQDSSAPTGFIDSVKATVTTADTSVASTQSYTFQHRIEGYNIADLAWGTANAKTVTLSFWVRSSLTGTFGGSIRNSATDRSYPFSYTISSANTWEQKSITIVGDTSGTWLVNNNTGINIVFSLGAGTDRSGTAGAWNSNNNTSATGAVSVIGTLNATWYITGVQLEVGSTATSFDYRPYGTELALCQRYYYRFTPTAAFENYGAGFCPSTVQYRSLISFPIPMRIAPTALEQSGTATDYSALISGGASVVCNAVPTFSTASIITGAVNFPVASGLTAGQGGFGRAVNTSAYLGWSAEL